ncbi:MAG: uncharacterized protein JWO08_4472 [Verrucomicrobiaceae bacterium]|nr:uncharacterized protein [Verrucomicrobiaceae bacterium]
MKIATTIVATLLGLLFIAASVPFFLHMMPEPKFDSGSLPALYMGSMGASGYMGFVKAFELIGGVLVAIPRMRNFGLLILGPIMINILAFSHFIMKDEGLAGNAVIALLPAFLLWSERRKFAGLLR